MSQRARLVWTAVALAASLGVAIAVEFWPREMPAVVTSGTAAVGGPFELKDHNGRPFTDRDLIGRASVLYFGWTHDRDLTPAALQVLGAAVARMEPNVETPRLVFVSIDPERDNQERLRAFKALFRDDVIVAAPAPGSSDSLRAAFKLYAKRIADPTLPSGYSLDHASLYYVMGKDGLLLGVIPHTTDVADLALSLQRLLK